MKISQKSRKNASIIKWLEDSILRFLANANASSSASIKHHNDPLCHPSAHTHTHAQTHFAYANAEKSVEKIKKKIKEIFQFVKEFVQFQFYILVYSVLSC